MSVIPEIVVRCGPRRDRTCVADPLVAVEVLSRSTMQRDRGVESDFCRAPPSLQRIVLVDPGQMRMEHRRRGAVGWAVGVLSCPSRRLDLDAAGFALALESACLDGPALKPVEVPGADEPEPPTPIP